MKVCIGVIDQPYDYGDDPDKTTYEVALDLQDRYGLFTHFWELHKKQIIPEVGETVALALINHIKYGAPMPDGQLLGETIRAFNGFLEGEEMAGLSVDGVPTWAAEKGKNSRLKQEHGPRRPSFIDGGLLKSNFIAWISNNAEP